MKLTEYTIKASIQKPVRIALVCDLHNNPGTEALTLLRKAKPDLIAACGDILMASYRDSVNGLEFLHSATELAPTFFVPGNHENRMAGADFQMLRAMGVTLLLDESLEVKGLCIGGVDPERIYNEGYHSSIPRLNMHFLDKFERMPGFKVLLCHYPDCYETYVKPRNIQLMLSGHTHGGQINFFGHGLYAAGQGFFPKYSAGIYEDRLIISRGLSNNLGHNVRGLTGVVSRHAPRILNPMEVVVVCLCPNP